MNGLKKLKLCKETDRKSHGCEIDFKIEDQKKLNQLNVILRDPILFDFQHYLLITLSKFYSSNKNFLDFKRMFNIRYNWRVAQAPKIGFKTDLLALNPFDNNIKVPVYFANFVLMDYGLGAVLGVLAMIKEILICKKI